MSVGASATGTRDHPEALAHMPALYATEKGETEDSVFLMRFYHPLSRQSWLAVEYDPAEKAFFGLADTEFQEWGYFSLLEMAFIEVQGVPLMWDVDFKPIRFGDWKAQEVKD